MRAARRRGSKAASGTLPLGRWVEHFRVVLRGPNSMRTFMAQIRVSNGSDAGAAWVEALVDTDATYTVLPETLLRERVGVSPTRQMTFTFADGREFLMPVGDARVQVNGLEAASPVVFREEGQYLLGATTLQSLGLIADTTNRELIPAPKLYI